MISNGCRAWEFRTLHSTAERGNGVKVETEAPASWRTPPEDCYSLHPRQAHSRRLYCGWS